MDRVARFHTINLGLPSSRGLSCPYGLDATRSSTSGTLTHTLSTLRARRERCQLFYAGSSTPSAFEAGSRLQHEVPKKLRPGCRRGVTASGPR